MADDMGEKTEQPTSKRLSDAREKGQIAKSPDLTAAVDLVAALLLVYYFGSWLTAGLRELLRRSLAGEMPGGDAAGVGGVVRDAAWSFVQAGVLAAPAMVAMGAVVVMAHLPQTQFLLTLEPLRPKLERLSPVEGLGRLFSKRSVVKTTLHTAKLTLIAAVVYLVVARRMPELAALPNLPLLGALDRMFMLVVEVAAYALAIMLTIGLVDYAYQRWQHTQDLRMTKQQVKEEFKSSEGDPDVKRRRAQIAREMATQRARRAVPKADVVVTNPTHFSVAIQYDAEKMAAPTVVAKGADFMAFRIREIAAAHGVPIVEKPPLARALYAQVEVGREVDAEFYEAVAEVLAYVYRLGGKGAPAGMGAGDAGTAGGDGAEDGAAGGAARAGLEGAL